MKPKGMKRIFAMLLSIMLSITMMPFGAFATEIDGASSQQETEAPQIESEQPDIDIEAIETEPATEPATDPVTDPDVTEEQGTDNEPDGTDDKQVVLKKNGENLRAEALSYVDKNDNAKQAPDNYNVYTGGNMSGEWYAVTQDITVNTITVWGNVNLILCDGVTLTANKGIKLLSGTNLVIWQQSGHTGKLVARGEEDKPGIEVPADTTLTINGGQIEARAYGRGAGIGGGSSSDAGTVNINGVDTKVEAYSVDGAGIGGGGSALVGNGGNGGRVTISGKVNVVAVSRSNGAGIGGGRHGDGGQVVINSEAVVRAEGGYEDQPGSKAAQAIGHGNVAITEDSGTLSLYDESQVTFGTVNGPDHPIIDKGKTIGSDRVNKCRKSYAEIRPKEWDGGFSVKKVWKDASGNELTDNKPESIKVVLQHYVVDITKDGSAYFGWFTEETKELNESNGWEAAFSYAAANAEDGDNWRIRELKEQKGEEEPGIVYDSGDNDIPQNEETNKVLYKVGTGDAAKNISYSVDYQIDDKGNATITNTIPLLSVEKKWTDAAGEPLANVPAWINIVLQHKNEEGNWETVEVADEQKSLYPGNQWQVTFGSDVITDSNLDNYRIREKASDGDIVYDRNDTDKPAGAKANQLKDYIEEDGRSVEKLFSVDYKVDASGKTTITNSLAHFSVEKKWLDTDGNALTENIPDSIKVVLQHNTAGWGADDQWVTVGAPVTLNAENGWKAAFDRNGLEDSEFVNTYRIRELKEAEGSEEPPIVYDSTDSHEDGEETNKVEYTVGTGDEAEKNNYNVKYDTDQNGNVVISNTLDNTKKIPVEKKWTKAGSGTEEEVLAADMIPDSVKVVLQHKSTENNVDKWETVGKPLSLKADGDWKGIIAADMSEDPEPANYRIRELKGDAEDSTAIVYDSEDTDKPEGEKTNAVTHEIKQEGKDAKAITYAVAYDMSEQDGMVITNSIGKLSVEKQWTKPGEGDGAEDVALDKTPESIKVVLQHKKTENNSVKWETVGEPATLNAANSWKADLLLTADPDKDNYRIRELASNGGVVYDKDDADKPNTTSDNDSEEYKPSVTYKVKDGEEEKEVNFAVTYAKDNDGNVTITNKLDDSSITLEIEKDWDIDLEKNDKPDSIQVLIQKKTDEDKWESVKMVELKGDSDWKATVQVEKPEEGKKPEDVYRVRELKEETALYEAYNKIKTNYGSQMEEKYNDWLNEIKSATGDAGSYYDMLPEDIRTAADGGLDQLKTKLGVASAEEAFNKLKDKIDYTIAEKRIVYDKEDKKKDDGDSDNGDKEETNAVLYHVEEHNSVVSGGKVDAHVTKYKVEYKKEDEGKTWKINNQAILEIDVIKRWIGIGVDDEDMPDSAWVALMFKVNPEAVENAKGLGGDVSKILDYEFPVVYVPAVLEILLDGGDTALNILSQLTLGVDLDIFEKLLPDDWLPKLAIAEVKKADSDDSSSDENGDNNDGEDGSRSLTKGDDNNDGNGDDDGDKDKKAWTAHFVVSKYVHGLPMEFKGAELSSEIIRQVIKYMTGGKLDLPVSYNPFSNYFSIPTKAIRTLMGITDPSDFLDLSNLAGKILEKAKSLTMEDIKNFGPSTLLDDWDLMANVINIKIDWNSDSTVNGTKIWKDEEAGKNHSDWSRPDWVKIHVKKDGKDWKTFELKKEDFEDQNEWTWDAEEKAEDGVEYTVTEEFPSDYKYKDYYVSETQGYDITNKWHENSDGETTVSGQKIWQDGNDIDKLRPKKVEVKLLADGEPAKYAGDTTTEDESGISAEISEQNGWRYVFTNLPKYKEGSTEQTPENEIKYTVEEVEVPEGYTAEYDDKSYNITNKHIPESMRISGTKEWEDNENASETRPQEITLRLKADGKEVAVTTTNKDKDWKWEFEGTYPIQKDGKDIEYTVTEDNIENYTSEITADEESGEGEGNGDSEEGNVKTNKVFKVTNTYTEGKTQVNVTKAWEDEDDQDQIRPDSVTIELWAAVGDGEAEPVKVEGEEGQDPEAVTLELSEDNKWTGSFTGLDAKDSKGQEITYSVKEKLDPEDAEKRVITGEDGEGTYAVEVSGSMTEGYTVTNKHTPTTVKISGTKEWKGDENATDKRPDEITLRLKADGKEVAETTTNKDKDWKWEFEGAYPVQKDGKDIEYTVTEDNIENYTSEITSDEESGEDEGNGDSEESNVKTSKVFKVTNTYTPGETQVNVTKVWEDKDDHDQIRPDSVTIELWAAVGDGEAEPVKAEGEEGQDPEAVTLELSEDNNWTGSFTGLDAKDSTGQAITYSIKEKLDPEDAEKRVITGEDGEGTYAVEVSGSMTEGYTVTNKHTPTNVKISGTKEWEDNENADETRPDEITLRLKADGKEVAETTTNEDKDWKWEFEDLYPIQKDGKDIEYTVSEDNVEDYTSEITLDEENSDQTVKIFNVTNTYTPGKTQVNVTKVWEDNDNQDGIRPSQVMINLMADGEQADSALLNESNDWTYSFTGLDAKEGLKTIDYKVEEVENEPISGEDGPGTYADKVTGDVTEGYTVTNTHTPETVKIKGSKTWKDSDNHASKRPDKITIHLKADGEEAAEVTAAEDNGWSWDFGEYPKYRNGKEIDYSITEDNVTDYTSEVKGFNVTNTYTPGKTQVNVSKVWKDNDNQDGIRPDSVTVELWATPVGGDAKQVKDEDGKEVTLVLSESNDWAGSFIELDAADVDGNPIQYFVKEVEDGVITGEDTDTTYDYSISDNDGTGNFIITNTHTPQITSVSGSKTWNDADDQDRKRPGSITIRLWADGEEIDNKTVKADGSGDWKWTFEGLPKYKAGKEINYSITEDVVENYTSEVNGYNVTNSYTPEKTQINAVKIWMDIDDQDNLRPQSVTIKLMSSVGGADPTQVKDKNGQPVKAVLSDDNEWRCSFTGLDKFKSGEKIKYTVEEETGAGSGLDAYESYVFGSMSIGYFAVNVHEPETVVVEGSKTWNDDDNQDGKRPESIVIHLWADGEKTDSKIVTEDDDWAWTFDKLPKYKAGYIDADGKSIPIRYAITEETVEDYTAAVDGYDVANEHTPGKVQVNVLKFWLDIDDQDGLRPESVTVKLMSAVGGAEPAQVKDENGNDVTLELSESNEWRGSFTGLDEYISGKKIKYTVEEETGEGSGLEQYESYVVGSVKNGYAVINQHRPETVDVEGVKTWDDNDNATGKRPGSITIHLLKGGETVETKTVTAKDEWKWSFTELPKNSHGEEIEYKIVEDYVAGYTTSYDGYSAINTVVPPEPDPDAKMHTITYDLNGGSYNGSTANIIEKYPHGTEILIHAEPVREGYTFKYWKGSEYRPGDKYVVNEDHTFVAQWEKKTDPNGSDDPNKPGKGAGTGDNSHILLSLILMTLSMLALVSTLLYRRRRG